MTELSMDIDAGAAASASAAPITFVRIKRKRNEGQLDALFIENARRKRARGETGLFEYAGTLEEGGDLQTIQDGFVNAPPSPTKERDLNPRPSERLIAPRPNRRYTILQKSEPAQEKGTAPARPAAPSATQSFTVYDAVADDSRDLTAEEDEQLKDFLPMLEKYLKLTESEVVIPQKDTNDDWVYDVFVHRPIGSVYDASTFTNVGTVSGLPPDLDDWDSDEGEYAGDSEDEDSNAEDFYQNDYPDERSDDSASDEYRQSDGEGSYIEDPTEYSTYDHGAEEGPRLRVRN